MRKETSDIRRYQDLEKSNQERSITRNFHQAKITVIEVHHLFNQIGKHRINDDLKTYTQNHNQTRDEQITRRKQ
ncbi:hypothetical protein N7495_003338 [Penicillium taxi]|uniref:uncharacterized protein n=1 Tax=Penicillium taxi TaxID=168475 RepID=UPI002544FCE5|nr:uncharacterized protein N7495_003338 [Penicillium taxi]KAJ5902810.1 hypothetical protein N7495_003338 [Penicillium taxi]